MNDWVKTLSDSISACRVSLVSASSNFLLRVQGMLNPKRGSSQTSEAVVVNSTSKLHNSTRCKLMHGCSQQRAEMQAYKDTDYQQVQATLRL